MAIYNLQSGLTIQSSLVFPGSTSGTVTISAPAVAGTQSYTLPTGLPGGSNYVLTSDTSGNLNWTSNAGGGGGTVTSVSVVSANGFAGTVATPTATPAITFKTSIGTSGTPIVLVGDGTAISALSVNQLFITVAAINGSSIISREVYLSAATPNTLTIKAPSTVASSITYTLPLTGPTNRNILSSDTTGNLSWISNVANSGTTLATNYTNYSNINVNDIFVGMAPTVASFGQTYTVDASDVAFGDMLFHQKPLATPSTRLPPAYFNAIAYDDTPVNGVVTPLYMAVTGSASLSVPGSAASVYTSKDGVNWTYVSTLATNSIRYNAIIATVSGTAPSEVRTWVIYPASGSVSYRSTNEGDTWLAGATLSTLGLSNSNGVRVIDGTIWFALPNSTATTNLWKSTNNSATNTAVNSGVTATIAYVLPGPGTGASRYIGVFSNSTTYSVSTNGGTSFTTATCAVGTAGGVAIYDTAASKYIVAGISNGLTIQTSSTGLSGSWTAATATGTTPGLVSATAEGAFAYLDSAGSATIGYYYLPSAGGTVTPGYNMFVYSDDAGATVKFKQVATSQTTFGTPVTGQVSVTPEIIFVTSHSYNHLGFRKKYIYVDDNNGMSKVPIGTYQCLGKAGTQTGSYLWRRVT